MKMLHMIDDLITYFLKSLALALVLIYNNLVIYLYQFGEVLKRPKRRPC